MKCASFITRQLSDNGVVKWKQPVVTDNSGSVSFTCDAQSGAKLSTGYRLITCEAVDSSGNRANCSFTIHVYGKIVCFILLYSYSHK